MATDLTPLGSASASSEFNASQSAEKAIDNNLTTQWAGDNSSFPYWWKIDFGLGSEQIIDQYNIQARNDGYWEEIPEDWTFEATSELLSADLTSPAMLVIADNDNGSEHKEHAFDNNTGTYFATTNTSMPHYIGIDLGVGNSQIINYYTIQARNDGSYLEAPYDWTFQGSTTGVWGGEEVTLDTRTSEAFSQNEKRSFDSFSGGINTTAYRYYRILATANQPGSGVGVLAVAELEFMSGFDWDVLDTQSGVSWTQFEKKTFNISNATAYRYYRFNISDDQGSGSNTSLLEVEMFQIAVIESEALQIADTIQVIDTTLQESDAIQISDSIIVTGTNLDAKFASKIISINPLIFVTDTSPIEIVKVDISDPLNPTWVIGTITGINSANDVTVNSDGTYIYIAGENGQVVKVEVAALSNQTIIDLSDTDNILTIEHNTNYGITYAGTDNIIGELYTIDERNTFQIDSDFNCLTPQEFKLDSNFNIVDAFKIDSAFTVLSYQYYKMNSDFKCLTKETVPITSVDDIIPINLEDYQVLIDSVELEDTDLILESISINHSVGEESKASFQLSRKHDQLNTTLEGVSSTITNKNVVEIKCNGVTIFPYNGVGTGRISELDCQYENDREYVVVSALSEEATNKFNQITMSLPGLSSRLSLYDILIQNPKIYDPYVNPLNEENPKKYKGIRVDLGTKIEQRSFNINVFDSNGNIADAIQEGTFNPEQNWTYFWSPTVKKIQGVVLNVPETTEEEDEIAKFDEAQRQLPISERKPWLKMDIRIRQTLEHISDGIQDTFDSISKSISELIPLNSIRFFYIGTSLAPVSEDLWYLKQATHWKQRVFDDIETELGSYEVGEAPFKDISVRNGQKITKPKLTDETNGLYSIKDAGYDFIDYAKNVADLEYEKLKNINDNILSDTSCTFNLTVDAYLYYAISLLTRMNVDNTTQANIYFNTNGFPISVKSITITSSDRKVSIVGDNKKSVKELEVINSQFPDEDDDEYNEEEQRTLISLKSDMRTRLQVQ